MRYKIVRELNEKEVDLLKQLLTFTITGETDYLDIGDCECCLSRIIDSLIIVDGEK
jgi:hypothetical protein